MDFQKSAGDKRAQRKFGERVEPRRVEEGELLSLMVVLWVLLVVCLSLVINGKLMESKLGINSWMNLSSNS